MEWKSICKNGNGLCHITYEHGGPPRIWCYGGVKSNLLGSINKLSTSDELTMIVLAEDAALAIANSPA